jgi:hypothetical protein
MSGISWDDATEGVQLPEFDGESQYLGKMAKKQLVESETPFKVTSIQLDQAGFSKTGSDPRWLLQVAPIHGNFPQGLLGMPCNPRRDPELAGAKQKLDAARRSDPAAFIGPVVLDVVGNREFLVLRPAPVYGQGAQAPLPTPSEPPAAPEPAPMQPPVSDVISPDGNYKLVDNKWVPINPPPPLPVTDQGSTATASSTPADGGSASPSTEVPVDQIPANDAPKRRGRPPKAESEATKAAQQKAQPPLAGPVFGSAFCPDCNDTIEGELAPFTEGGFALLHRCPTTGLFKPLTQDVEVTSA